jgi:hypothetical protein
MVLMLYTMLHYGEIPGMFLKYSTWPSQTTMVLMLYTMLHLGEIPGKFLNIEHLDDHHKQQWF